MNLVGKIFVILILVMSICFMTFAISVYSAHIHWRDEAKTNLDNFEAERLLRQNAEQENALLTEQYTAETQDLQRRLAAATSELDRTQQDFDQLRNENAITVQASREAVAAMEMASDTLAATKAELATLREQIKDVQKDRDDKVRLAIATTDELNQRLTELERLNQMNLEIAENLAKAELVLDQNGLDLNMPVDGPPKVDGRIVAVGNGRVEISIGSDEGLRRGHTLEVFRGSRYLGRIEVERTQPDKAVAKILPEFRKGPIVKEDRVATRLN